MFELKSPEEFFSYIKDTHKQEKLKNYKLSDLFFLIMSLNHLREWIAPGYKPKYDDKTDSFKWPVADTKEKQFSKFIYEQNEFQTIRKLCNGTKHLSKQTPKTTVDFGTTLAEWENLSEIRNVAQGFPLRYFVDGVDAHITLESVICLYESWFEKREPWV